MGESNAPQRDAIESLPPRMPGAQYLWFTRLDNLKWSCIYANGHDLGDHDAGYPETEGGTMIEAAWLMCQWLENEAPNHWARVYREFKNRPMQDIGV